MIDLEARASLAERLRKLASGAISNFEFERRAVRSNADPAIRQIENRLAWRYYDDLREHTLSGEHALSDGARRDFARAVLFLQSTDEYRWPLHPSWSRFVKRFTRLFDRRPLGPFNEGELRYWPFWSEDDYRASLARPTYLSGTDSLRVN